MTYKMIPQGRHAAEGEEEHICYQGTRAGLSSTSSIRRSLFSRQFYGLQLYAVKTSHIRDTSSEHLGRSLRHQGDEANKRADKSGMLLPTIVSREHLFAPADPRFGRVHLWTIRWQALPVEPMADQCLGDDGALVMRRVLVDQIDSAFFEPATDFGEELGGGLLGEPGAEHGDDSPHRPDNGDVKQPLGVLPWRRGLNPGRLAAQKPAQPW